MDEYCLKWMPPVKGLKLNECLMLNLGLRFKICAHKSEDIYSVLNLCTK